MIHTITENSVSLGQRFITCSCGHRVSGGVGDTIAEQNITFHIRTATTARDAAVFGDCDYRYCQRTDAHDPRIHQPRPGHNG